VTNFGTHHSSSFDRNEIVILIGKFLLTEGFPAHQNDHAEITSIATASCPKVFSFVLIAPLTLGAKAKWNPIAGL
jgi:hypothetical protein